MDLEKQPIYFLDKKQKKLWSDDLHAPSFVCKCFMLQQMYRLVLEI